jgi:predicted trehalose synthase
MDREFTDRLDAELASVKARIEAQKRLLESTGDLQNETAAADLRALLDRLEALEESRRKIEEQSHGG